MKIPKYIDKKVDRLEKLIDEAVKIKMEIECWADVHGAETESMEWYNEVCTDYFSVCGISKSALHDYMEDLEEG